MYFAGAFDTEHTVSGRACTSRLLPLSGVLPFGSFQRQKKIRTAIAYLTKHGEAGRLKYPTFRARGLPLGSGAIESSIRRVINLRLKGNGISWYESNAEEMLQVRAQVIANRWDERMRMKRQHLRYDGRCDWRWEPQPMSCKT